MKKICNRCFQSKSLADFYKNRAMPDGYIKQCRSCVLEAQNQRYHQIKETTSYVLGRREYYEKRSKLFTSLKKKNCLKCNKTRKIKFFGLRKSSKDGYREYCKACYVKMSVDRQRITPRSHISAARRASKKQAMPEWVDRTKLKQVYKNCPKGHHVDHIIPLKNEIVCGLHVPWNLQYLPASDNIRKGNKLIF